jgi:hypothetical protein
MNPNLEIPGPDGNLIAAIDETQPEDVAAWEEIAPGRFMPRRVRGSFHGRVLG